MSEHDDHDGGSASGRRGYELSDISTKVAVVSAAALVIAGILVHVFVWLLYVSFGQAASASYSPQYPLAAAGAPPLPAAPVLQVKPREDLKRLVTEEETLLHSTDWVDRNAGIVRIPIERAMQLVIERGLPVRAETGTAAAPAGQASRLPEASRFPEALVTPHQGATPGTGRQ